MGSLTTLSAPGEQIISPLADVCDGTSPSTFRLYCKRRFWLGFLGFVDIMDQIFVLDLLHWVYFSRCESFNEVHSCPSTRAQHETGAHTGDKR